MSNFLEKYDDNKKKRIKLNVTKAVETLENSKLKKLIEIKNISCDIKSEKINKYVKCVPKILNQNQSTLWTEKYRPQNIDEIIGNQQQISFIKKWIDNFKKTNTNNGLLIYGPVGTSKTTCANVLLKSAGYKVLYFNGSDLSTKKLIEEKITSLLNTEQSVKYAIVMDEIEGLTSGKNGGMDELIKLLNTDVSTLLTNQSQTKKRITKKVKQTNNIKYIPIICISNNINESMFDNIKKYCTIIEFKEISNNNIEILIDRIMKNENFTITDNAKKIFVENSQQDFRRCLNLLQTFYQIDKNITEETITKYKSFIVDRSIELNYIDTAKKLIYTSDFNNILAMYKQYKHLLPMLMHENYISYVNNFKNCSKRESLLICKNIIHNMCDADTIDKTMYNNQNWNMQNIHGIKGCCIPNYYINSKEMKFNKSSIPILYPQIYTKFSSYKQNIININTIVASITTNNRYTIEDIQTLGIYLLYNLLSTDENRILYGFKILHNYNLTISDIEKLIKMNKISIKNTIYKPQIKKQLNTLHDKTYGNNYIQREINTIYYNFSNKVVSDSESDND